MGKILFNSRGKENLSRNWYVIIPQQLRQSCHQPAPCLKHSVTKEGEKHQKYSGLLTWQEKKKEQVETVDDTLATAVPEPIAIPISAFFSAGASLTPSPVIAT